MFKIDDFARLSFNGKHIFSQQTNRIDNSLFCIPYFTAAFCVFVNDGHCESNLEQLFLNTDIMESCSSPIGVLFRMNRLIFGMSSSSSSELLELRSMTFSADVVSTENYEKFMPVSQ